MRALTFSYGVGLPRILDSANLEIRCDETVAIVGASGVGKSTVIKLICGLLRPDAGEVYVNGKPLANFGLRRFRERLGVVSQDDQLFAGSLSENITFFDIAPEQDWLMECCRCANIYNEIVSMPMGFDTSIGDMGSGLSGGQKQRVFLARALYKRPELLIMDEGTSHLDLPTEAAVSEAIHRLGITRLIIAHRPETIRRATRVLSLFNGRFVDVTESSRLRAFQMAPVMGRVAPLVDSSSPAGEPI